MMKASVKSKTITFLMLSVLLGAIYTAIAFADPHSQAMGSAPVQIYTLQGRVYEGETGLEQASAPLAGVTVSLYCSNNQNVQGAFLRSTTTNAEGWYGLDVTADDICEYFNIIETDPPGYTSNGATTVGGSVVDANWIEYAIPLAGKTLTGNKFWDNGPATHTPTPTPIPPPTHTPTATTAPATDTPTTQPTNTPTPQATYTPTDTPTRAPTDTPTATSAPVTDTPTTQPTSTPTSQATTTLTPTATPTPSLTCSELLNNGDFETGDLPPWMTFGTVAMGPGRESNFGARLGGADNAEGELLQTVAIPAGTNPVQLQLWWLAENEIAQPDDVLDVIIQFGEEQADHLLSLPALEPLGEWQQATLNLEDYAGMEVVVTFLVHTDAEAPTTFHLDDISLQACGQPAPTPTATPTSTPLPAAYSPQEYTWEFSGRVESETGEPLPGMELKLLGSAEAGQTGQMLDWTSTNADGNFLLRYDRFDIATPGFPYIQIVLLHPGAELIEAGSESGGDHVGNGWLAFTQPPPDHYGGNIYRVNPLYLQGPPPIKLCAIADSVVKQGSATTNFGKDAYLTAGYYSRGCGGACRSLVRFNMDWAPSGATITAAEMQAYQEFAGGRSMADVRAYRVTVGWNENTVTWNNQPSVADPATTTSLGTGAGYKTWNVNKLVEGWLDGSFSNYGLELRGAEEWPEWWRDFRSRETTTPPRLVLYHTGKSSFSVTPTANKPYIVLTPNQGEAGTVFWVRGYNLKPASTYHLYWDTRQSGNHLVQVKTDALGAFGVQVSAPSAAAVGFHPVLLYWQDAIEQMYKLQAQAPFLVEPPCWSVKPPLDLNPQITLSPTQGPSNGGNTVQVVGKGWSPNTNIKLFWDDPALCSGNNSYCLGQVKSDGKGKFVTSFTVPPNQAVTGHLVIARNHPFTAPVQQATAAYRTTDPPSPPANDTQPPTVFVNHTISYLYSGGPPITIYFRASAWDPLTTASSYNGITRIDIWAWPVTGFYPLIHKTCQVSGWTPSMQCLQVENGPWNSSITGFYYFAQARDRSNNVANSPVKIAWLINDGPDSDNDGLSDKVEKATCTNPNNPDTDRDNLLDGWEVEGLEFPDGRYIDLPSMGANPCVKDMFVEVDWTPGRKPNPTQDFQPVINAYQQHGIRLHIDYGQWGGGEEVTLTSTTAANVAARNNFDPHRLWAFHYAVFRPPLPNAGSSFCERGKVFFIGDTPGTAAQTFMHELGHCTGLGHGGMTGPNTQKRSGTATQQKQWGFQWVWYDQDSVSTNNKPNYLSVMNYNWNGLVYVPAPNCAGTNCFVFLYDYSERALPTLDENSLDERATSNFIQQLRSYPLPASAPANGVPLVMYACRDPNENNALYGIATDGHQMIGRFRAGSPWPGGWQFSNLPAQNGQGIDWDCDGQIEANVSGNINGCSGNCFFFHNPQTPGEKLTGTNDWARIPSFDPCPGDAWFGQGFLKSAHNPPCESNGWAPSPYPPDDPPWLHAIPAEYCNGRDDNDNGLIDEGCADSDEDGIVDDLDNCPLAFNPGQEDGDQNGLGDACSEPPPPPAGLSVTPAGGAVRLSWEAVDAPGVIGYNVYRQVAGETVFQYMGEGWPITAHPEFWDEPAPSVSARYFVRTVASNGLESEPSETVSVLFGEPLYLPLIAHD